MLSRRGLLLGAAGGLVVTGGAAAGLVEAGVLPGRGRLHRALGRCGDAPEPPGRSGHVRRHRFRSRFQAAEVNLVMTWPANHPSPRGLRVAFALHGNGGDAESVVSGLHLHRYMSEVNPAFALVALDGGPDGYWHPRRGADPLRMMTDEVLPWLGKQGVRTDRFAVIGWSMGGYGALLMGEQAGAPRVAAVVASSPALFESYADARRTNRLAFDDQADFARHNVVTGAGRLAKVPTWVDCGSSDPFAPMAERFRSRIRPAGGGIGRGCHDGAYWTSRLPDQLAFIANNLRT
jgi:pimeloyl-ACP methyl ester carboxylesterase